MMDMIFDQTPSVAVIILNWNTPKITEECINSIFKSDYPKISIYLTDNGSTDRSYEKLKERFTKNIYIYHLEINRGYVGGMNFCIGQAIQSNPDYLLIMNNDTIIDPHAISSLVKAAKKNSNCCVVTGKVYNYDDPKRLQTVGNNFELKRLRSNRIGFNEIDIGQYSQEMEREMIDDIFMLLPVNIYREVGGYSTYFYLNYEQTDLILRIKKRGYKAIFTPTAKLWHKGSFSSGGVGNPYMMYWEGKSFLILHRLHQRNMEFIKFYMTYAMKIIYSLLKGLLGTLFGVTKNLKSRYATFRGFIAGTIWLFNAKEEAGRNPFEINKK